MSTLLSWEVAAARAAELKRLESAACPSARLMLARFRPRKTRR
jgi:hypothetical protein